MGSEHFVGLAGSGAATGIAVVAYEWQVSHLFHVFFSTLTLLLLIIKFPKIQISFL